MAGPDCQIPLEALSAHLDGEASPELRAEVERHLADCPDCSALANTLLKTVSLCRELPRPELPPDVRQRLYGALDL
jgi:anti-sigma factor RsiW